MGFFFFLSYFILFCLFYFFPNLSVCLLIEICSASYFPYQPRCNHPQVTASISFPEKETATGNGESSSERQHLYSGCSFRIPTSLPAPFLCSKTLQMTPQLRVHLFSPGPDCCKPSGDAGGELFFQSLPSFPGVTGPTHLREAKGSSPPCLGERGRALSPRLCTGRRVCFPRVFAAIQNC